MSHSQICPTDRSLSIAGVDAKLHEVEENHGDRILLAIESASRGWGFPSPDSDYDCRFIHVRLQSDYLSLYPPRDVIEYPPDAIYDVNGWDLVKTLKLLLKGNAVVLEWLMSPFVERGDAELQAGDRQNCMPTAFTFIRVVVGACLIVELQTQAGYGVR